MMMEYHSPGYSVFRKYLYDVMSPDSRTHGSGNQRVDMGMGSTGKFCFSIPSTLGCDCGEVLFLKGRHFQRGSSDSDFNSNL